MVEETEVGRKVCKGLSTGRYFNDSEFLLFTLSLDLTPTQCKNAHQKFHNCTGLQSPSERASPWLHLYKEVVTGARKAGSRQTIIINP